MIVPLPPRPMQASELFDTAFALLSGTIAITLARLLVGAALLIAGWAALMAVFAFNSANPAVAISGALICGLPILLLLGAGALRVYAGVLLTLQVIMLERCGVRTALRRSWLLTGDYFWRIAGIILASGVLRVLPLLAAQFVPRVLPREPDFWNNVLFLWSFFSLILAVDTLFWAMQIAIRTLLYHDLRFRDETYDLELRIRQFAESPGGDPPIAG